MLLNNIKNTLRPAYHKIKKGEAQGFVFMLHRVDKIDQNRLKANENMKVSPEFLESFILTYRDKYDFIPIFEIPDRLKNNSKKKFMAFTLDDGYRDNYTQAFPLFRKYKVPFTVFIATDFPDNKAILWWYVLEDYLLNNKDITLSNGMTFSLKTKEEKERAFMEIRSVILQLDQHNLYEELDTLFIERLPWLQASKQYSMSWDNIRECASSELVTIGGHTQHHFNLKQLESNEDVYYEIKAGCDNLLNTAGIKTEVFAYPFGSPYEVGEREINAVCEMGFKLACIAGGGYCGTRHINPYAIPRIMLTEGFREEDLQ